jgi:hypothetical protein
MQGKQGAGSGADYSRILKNVALVERRRDKE